MEIAVIGAGVGGLTAACLLSHEGHNVTVYEKNRRPGGKMSEVRAEGFRFDTGPSLLTMPFVLERIFRHCGKKAEDYLTLTEPDPLCRYFYPDGTVFDCFQERNRIQKELNAIASSEVTAYYDFLNYSESLYQRTADAFLFNPLFHLKDLKEVNFPDLFRIDAFRTVSKRIDSCFQSRYLRQFFKRFSTYNGSSPYQAPATLNVIPHVELNMGGYYIEGGIYRLAEKLFDLGKSNSVNFQFDTEVKAIKVENDAINGIELENGAFHKHDIIVSNSDAFETYLNLLPDDQVRWVKKRRLRSTEPSCSGFVLLLGIDSVYNRLVHHNVFFSDHYKEEFDAIFNRKYPSPEPTIYIANTSYSDPGHAPDGGSNLFVLVNAPYLTQNFDWNSEKEDYADLIIKLLERRGMERLSKSILFREIITPLDFYQKYRSNRGSIYGTSSNSRLSAFLRPRNKARGIEGLYLVGGSTHPGGGVPLAMLSAFNAMELIKRDYN